MENKYSAGRLLVLIGVIAALLIIFVAFRMTTRVLNHKIRGWDDVVVLIALARQLGIAGAIIELAFSSLEYLYTSRRGSDEPRLYQKGGIGYHRYISDIYLSSAFRPFPNCSFRERRGPPPSIVYDGNLTIPAPGGTRDLILSRVGKGAILLMLIDWTMGQDQLYDDRAGKHTPRSGL